MSCQRLKIECLGYVEKRPDWMRVKCRLDNPSCFLADCRFSPQDPGIDATNAMRKGLKQFLRPYHQIPEYCGDIGFVVCHEEGTDTPSTDSLSFQELYANDATYIPPFPILAQYAWPCNNNPDLVLDNTVGDEEDRWDSGSERADTPLGTNYSQGQVDPTFASVTDQGATRALVCPSQQSTQASTIGHIPMIRTAAIASQDPGPSTRLHIQMAGLTNPSTSLVFERGSVAHFPAAPAGPLWQSPYPALRDAGSALNGQNFERWGDLPHMAQLNPCSYRPDQPNPALSSRPHPGCMIIPNIQPTAFQAQFSSASAPDCVPCTPDNTHSSYPFSIPPGDTTV